MFFKLGVWQTLVYTRTITCETTCSSYLHGCVYRDRLNCNKPNRVHYALHC